jgi:hypothetical protein
MRACRLAGVPSDTRTVFKVRKSEHIRCPSTEADNASGIYVIKKFAVNYRRETRGILPTLYSESLAQRQCHVSLRASTALPADLATFVRVLLLACTAFLQAKLGFTRVR